MKSILKDILIIIINIALIIFIFIFLIYLFHRILPNTPDDFSLSKKQYYLIKERLGQDKSSLKQLYNSEDEVNFAIYHLNNSFPKLNLTNKDGKNTFIPANQNYIISIFFKPSKNTNEFINFLDKNSKEKDVLFVPVFIIKTDGYHSVKEWYLSAPKDALFVHNDDLLKKLKLRKNITTFFVDSDHNISLVRENEYQNSQDFERDFELAFTKKITAEWIIFGNYGEMNRYYIDKYDTNIQKKDDERKEK